MTTAGFAKILQIGLGCFQDFLGRVTLQTRGGGAVPIARAGDRTQ